MNELKHNRLRVLEQRTPVATNGETLEAQAHGSAKVRTNLDELMGDAPACTTCGHMTIRNGTCYKCVNCGTSIGCS